MPQEDIHTVCRIRPLSAAIASDDTDPRKPRTGLQTRCVVVDPLSNKRKVKYTQPPPEKTNNNTATRNSRANAAGTRGGAPEETVLAFDYVAGEVVFESLML